MKSLCYGLSNFTKFFNGDIDLVVTLTMKIYKVAPTGGRPIDQVPTSKVSYSLRYHNELCVIVTFQVQLGFHMTSAG